jgi:site-specific recombinase XerD
MHMPPSPSPSIEAKINDFLQYLAVSRGSSPLTIRNYAHYLKRFYEYVASMVPNPDISLIQPELVQQYREYLTHLSDHKGGTLSRKTQGYHAIALRSFLKWMNKQDLEVMAPDKIELPKIEDRQVKFLSEEQVERLLAAPTLSNIAGRRDKAILELLFSTGLRVSELTHLNKDSVDLERREFGVVGKGGKARVVFLSERSAEWLRQYLSARRDHYTPMFIRHKGKHDPSVDDNDMRLTPRSIQRMVKKYVKKIKLPVEATPHVLRHSFATDLLTGGADLRSVQEMLGHKNVATTQIYTHVTNKHLREVHEAFHGLQRSNAHNKNAES